MSIKQTSNGGSTSYYELPPGATELNDLIEHKNMPFWRGNIFKASYRLGEKDCAEEEYDLRKIIYFAERRLKQIEKEKASKPKLQSLLASSGLITRTMIVNGIETPVDAIGRYEYVVKPNNQTVSAMYGGLVEDGSDAF